MFQPNAILTIEALQSWFYRIDKHGIFSIYRGSEKKSGERIISYKYDGIDEGWNLLQQTIQDVTVGGGQLTIYVSSKESDTSGYTVRYSPAIQLPGFANPQGISGTQESIGAIVAEKIAAFKQEFAKEQEIESLKAQIDDIKRGKRKAGIMGLVDQIGEAMEEYPTLGAILSNLAGAMISKMTDTPPQHMPGMAGPKITHVRPSDSDNGDDPEETGFELTDDDIDRLTIALSTIGTQFQDPVDVVEKISRWIEKNPQMAHQLFANI